MGQAQQLSLFLFFFFSSFSFHSFRAQPISFSSLPNSLFLSFVPNQPVLVFLLFLFSFFFSFQQIEQRGTMREGWCRELGGTAAGSGDLGSDAASGW